MDKAVEDLQSDFKVLKNQIKEILSDIREHLLTNLENPFLTNDDGAPAPQRIVTASEVAITMMPAPPHDRWYTGGLTATVPERGRRRRRHGAASARFRDRRAGPIR